MNYIVHHCDNNFSAASQIKLKSSTYIYKLAKQNASAKRNKPYLFKASWLFPISNSIKDKGLTF